MQGILIPIDGTPIPVPLENGIADIESYAPGPMEVVHADEYVLFWAEVGLRRDVPVNRLASLIAKEAIFGPVIVTGVSPSGMFLLPAPRDWLQHTASVKLSDVSP